MKKERLQQTIQKYKGLQDEQLYGNKMNNLEEMEILRKVQSSESERGRNRNYEQPN